MGEFSSLPGTVNVGKTPSYKANINIAFEILCASLNLHKLQTRKSCQYN